MFPNSWETIQLTVKCLLVQLSVSIRFLSPLEEREGYLKLTLTFLLAVERKKEKVGKNLKAFEYYEHTATLSFPVPVSIRSCSESNLGSN